MDGHTQYTPSRSDDWLVHDGNEVSGAHSIGSGASPTLAYSNGRPARPQGQMQHHEGDVGLVDQVHAYLDRIATHAFLISMSSRYPADVSSIRGILNRH